MTTFHLLALKQSRRGIYRHKCT